MTNAKKPNLAPLWERFEKSGSIQAYLKYHKAKLGKPEPSAKAAAKPAAKRRKVAA